jgi:hypothetical protein
MLQAVIASDFAWADYSREFSGYGKKKIDNIPLQEGLAILEVKYSRPWSINVNLHEKGGENGKAILERGPLNNKYFLNIPKPGTYFLDIVSNGTWRIKITQMEPLTGRFKPLKFNGSGSQISPFFYLDRGFATFRVTKIKSGKYRVITTLGDAKGRPVVGETGVFIDSDPPGTSTKTIEIRYPGIYMLQVQSEGLWEVKIE